ncbi:MAG: 1,4-alpha-glucan branching enzyme [Bacteroidetes bacterium]|nr:MAG: 1,4-alpha-glucan branching enzyme [Bacteroidota bacterium]
MSNQVISTSLFSDDDIYLFKAGKHQRAYRHFGAHLMMHENTAGCYFAVYAPSASRVEVIGNFNGWNGENFSLNVRWDSSGIWEGFIPHISAGDIYKYKIFNNDAGEILEKADPYARQAEHPPKTASIVSAESNYGWEDNEWMKERAKHNSIEAPLSVYEVHLASWKRKENGDVLGYRELAEELVPYVKKAGFTHVEFMPIMEYPYEPSWGYQITGYFAASSRFGNAEDLKYLVDAFHKEGIGVILDWVPSHFPADAHGLGNFDGTCVYEHPDDRKGYHPDWKSLIFNYGRPEVKSFLISNAIFWLDQFHIDALRVDAVASMLYLDYSREDGQWEPNEFGGNENLDAIAFIKEFNEAVYGSFPDVQTIAEESTSFSKVSFPTFDGGLGFGLKWMMGWMNDGLEYFKRDPIYRSHHHNEITFSLAYAFTEHFMLPLSHDEVVYGKKSLLEKMPGDSWQQFANLRLLFSWMYLHPGAKLIFMGGEFGQREEWKFAESLSWQELEGEAHGGIFNTISQLNGIYRSEKSLHKDNYNYQSFRWIEHNDHHNSVLSFIRKSGDEELVCVLNLTPKPLESYSIGVPAKGSYHVIFNSDEGANWGSDFPIKMLCITGENAIHGFEQSLDISLAPLAALVYKMKK